MWPHYGGNILLRTLHNALYYKVFVFWPVGTQQFPVPYELKGFSCLFLSGGCCLGPELSSPYWVLEYQYSFFSAHLQSSLCTASSFLAPIHILELDILSPCSGRWLDSIWVPSPCPVAWELFLGRQLGNWRAHFDHYPMLPVVLYL